MKNIFVSTTFAKDDSKISDVLAECKKENISNVELGSNHIYEKDLKKIITDPDFSKVYKILEFRNTSIKNIKNALKLLNK